MKATTNVGKLKQAVCEGLDVEAIQFAQAALDEGVPAITVLNEGVVAGLQMAGRLWQEGEYFVPEVVLSAEAFRHCVDLLKPRLRMGDIGRAGRCMFGTVAGDMHDLGKSIVMSMLSGAGFEMIDLGVDVPTHTFVSKVAEMKPDILGIGAYMTTTMLVIKDVITALERAGLRKSLVILVGGVSVTHRFAEQVGADGYASDALTAVQVAVELLERKRHGT